MSNWRRDKEFVENFMNNYDVPFQIMPKTTNNTWKQIREDLNKKLLIEENNIIIEENENLIEENEHLIEENEDLIEENKNLMLEIERLQNDKFEKIVLIVVSIIFTIIAILKA